MIGGSFVEDDEEKRMRATNRLHSEIDPKDNWEDTAVRHRDRPSNRMGRAAGRLWVEKAIESLHVSFPKIYFRNNFRFAGYPRGTLERPLPRFRRVTPEGTIASMRSRSALLEALGGEEGCRRLSAAFYARVGKDPVLRPFFPGKSLRCATEEFAAFLIQFLGGDEKQTQ
jgi:hypothetical protein